MVSQVSSSSVGLRDEVEEEEEFEEVVGGADNCKDAVCDTPPHASDADVCKEAE